MSKQLKDLDPMWNEHYLEFCCPTCPRSETRYSGCVINIPTEPKENGWRTNGEKDFDKLTVTPSIWHHCDTDPHFFIREGKIDMV